MAFETSNVATPAGTRARRVSAVTVVMFAAVALLMAGASIALACTGRASIDDVSPGKGEAGDQVTVSGSGFDEGGPGDDAAVQIRWDSDSGKQIGTAQGPDFAVNVKIPSTAASGPHVIIAVAYDKSTGEVEGRDSFAFEVTSSEERSQESDQSTSKDSSASTSGDTSSDSSNSSKAGSSGESNTSGTTSGSTSGSTSGDSSSDSSTTKDSSSNSPSSASESASSSSDSSTSRDNTSSSDRSSTRDATRESDAAASSSSDEQPARQPAARAADQDTVFGQAASADQPAADTHQRSDDTAAEEAGQPTAASAPRVPAGLNIARDGRDAAEAQVPSARAGTSDLWSGFEPDGEALTSNLTAPDTVGQPAAAGGQVMLAAGLIGAGVLVLTAGGLLALRRRRQLATAGSGADAGSVD